VTDIAEFAQHLVTSCLLHGSDEADGRTVEVEVLVENGHVAVEVMQEQVGLAYHGGARALLAVTVVAARHGLDRDELLREALNLLAERD
jgi:hypothetical protein